MSPARRPAPRLTALVVEAIDSIASAAQRYDVLDRALLLANCDSIPTNAQELLDFVDGPLHEAVFAILGAVAAELLHEQLGILIARAGFEAAVDSETPSPSGPRTLPAPGPTPTPTSDVAPTSSRRGSGAYTTRKTPAARRRAPSSPERYATLGYSTSVLLEKGDKHVVVVVDDDPAYRRALVRMLDSAGYDANGAPDTKTALWMCEKMQPDLVVTDLELGEEMDGLGLAAQINKQLGAGAPPIILVTASARLPKATENVARIMVKTVDDQRLTEAAAELLRTDEQC